MKKKVLAESKSVKNHDKVMTKFLIILLAFGVMVFGVVLYVYLSNSSGNAASSADDDSSSFIPIVAGVWVPIIVVFANREKKDLTERQKKMLRILSILLVVALIAGIAIFTLTVL